MQSQPSFQFEISRPDSFCAPPPVISQSASFKEQLSDLELGLGKCSLNTLSKSVRNAAKHPRNILIGIHEKINLHLQDRQHLTRAQIRRLLVQLKNLRCMKDSDRHIAQSARTILVKMLDTLSMVSATFEIPENDGTWLKKRSRPADMFATMCSGFPKKVKTGTPCNTKSLNIVVHCSSENISFPLEMLTNQDFQSIICAEEPLQSQSAAGGLPDTLTINDIPNSSSLNVGTRDEICSAGVLNNVTDHTLQFPTEPFSTGNIESSVTDNLANTSIDPPVLSSETDIFDLNTLGNTANQMKALSASDKQNIILSQTQSPSFLPISFQVDHPPRTQHLTPKTANLRDNKPSKKCVSEKITKYKAKLRPIWPSMTNEQKVIQKHVEKFGINIFENPVGCLLDLDYENPTMKERPPETIIEELNKKMATINYRQLTEMLNEAVVRHVQFQLERQSGHSDSDSDGDDYDKKCKLRLKELQKVAREGMETFKQEKRSDIAALEDSLQKNTTQKTSWQKLVKFWKMNDELNSENAKMVVE